jgi:hypothetical protein
MKSLHEGRDYQLYKVYIWGGLALIVIYIALVAIIESMMDFKLPDHWILGIVSAPITPWVMGALAYWWWVFLVKGNQEFKESIQERSESVPEISELKNWSRLHTTMSLSGGSVEEMLAAEKASRGPVVIWYGLMNVFVLWILGNFWVWVIFQNSLPENYIMKVWVPGVIVIMVLFFIGTPFLVSRAYKEGENAYMAPLGLIMGDAALGEGNFRGIQAIADAAKQKGAVVFSGSRRERLVGVVVIGKHCFTWVRQELPAFEIKSDDGKLMVDKQAPDAVRTALKELRKAKRWTGIKLTSGSKGIWVERESPGENMWLYDLWLIERVLEAFS